MNKQLPHADVIKHTAEHGLESVEYKVEAMPLHIDDFPFPETEAPPVGAKYYLLLPLSYAHPRIWSHGSVDMEYLACGRVYLDKANRDKADELLITALRGGK